jgi:transposase
MYKKSDRFDCPGCQRLRRENTALKERLAQLEQRLAELEQQTHRQAAPFRRRQQRPKPKPPGRPQGHAPAQRSLPKPDRIVEVALPDCPDCHGALEQRTVQPQFQTDLPPIRPIVTQFNIQAGYCPRCRQRYRGRHPEQTSDAVGAAGNQLGPHALSMAAELKHRLGVPYRKIRDFYQTWLGLSVAPGALARAGQRLAAKAQPSYALLIDALRRCGVVHADETGWRIGRLNAWLWVFSSPTVTVYVIRTSRGHEVPEEILGPDFAGVLVVDGFGAYRALEYLQGQCVGHLLRRTERLAGTATDPDRWYLEELTTLFRQALQLAARRDQLTPRGYGRRVQQLERGLDAWLAWHGRRPSPDLQRLAKHVEAHRVEWFMFLYDWDVPPTNNHAERMLRPAVISRKVGGCNKTARGAATHGVLASVLVTLQQQGRRFLDWACALLRARDPTSLPLMVEPG